MDDAAVFSGAIEEGTISKIQKDSIGTVAKLASVDSKAKLASTWANLKRLWFNLMIYDRTQYVIKSKIWLDPLKWIAW